MQNFRKSIRLKDFDYSSQNAYFVTACAEKRRCIFGHVLDGGTTPTTLGGLIERKWAALPSRFPIEIDYFQLMPNHIHGIFLLTDESRARGLRAGTFVAKLKEGVVKEAFAHRGISESDIWQRGFYEHVIRSEKVLNKIREYIANNPMRWQFDRENVEGAMDDVEKDFWREFGGSDEGDV